MSYSKKLEEWQERMRRKAEDITQKYGVKSKVDQGIKAAGDALKKGAEAVSSGIDAAKSEYTKFDEKHNITERVKKTATQAQEKFTTGARAAEEKVFDVFGDARQYYDYASDAYEFSTRTARVTNSLTKVVLNARNWIKENPGKTAIISLSLIVGTRAGTAFPGLDVAILGAGGAGHWLFHSSVAPYGLRKLSEKYADYLKEQEELITSGNLSEADRVKLEFQKNAMKYVGAPLLGAFSIAAGSVLVYEALTGGAVTGFPINLIIGGNPILSSIWLFGNGLVCFHNGYKFFMIALADEKDVERIVREVKALLPATAGA